MNCVNNKCGKLCKSAAGERPSIILGKRTRLKAIEPVNFVHVFVFNLHLSTNSHKKFSLILIG